MADQTKKRAKDQDLLWMFRRDTGLTPPKEVDFDPSDAIYQLYKQTRNPFLKRAIAPSAKKPGQTAADLNRLFRFFEDENRYSVSPSNVDEPYFRRELAHPSPPPANDPAYLEPKSLTGDPNRLPWMIDLFFRSILSQLNQNPGRFKLVVEDLMEQIREDRIRIKIYDAYRTFNDWDDLMETIEEISRYPSPETFDLFCSALIVYYQLAYPDAKA